ncbi:MAG: hypothetical protein ABIS03_14075 [Gemmatimonadaceae bacterium]
MTGIPGLFRGQRVANHQRAGLLIDALDRPGRSLLAARQFAFATAAEGREASGEHADEQRLNSAMESVLHNASNDNRQHERRRGGTRAPLSSGFRISLSFPCSTNAGPPDFSLRRCTLIEARLR